MKPVTTFLVSPSVPPSLAPLKELASNFWWCWNAEAADLFRRIDPVLWDEVHHDPTALLARLPHQRLLQLSERTDYLRAVEDVYADFRTYMEGRGWYSETNLPSSQYFAYFCAEFGIHESFPVYSGGLGVLAGDHLKSASDLGLPLVAIGLLYQEGYFHQYLTQNGWQNERYAELDFHSLPLTPVVRGNGTPILIDIDLPLGKCYARIWKANIGRVPLYLLDTNVPENENPVLRDVTDRLYGGTIDTRIMQEMVLGIGGVRALHELGIDPAVIHINEGHAAFSMLERSKAMMSAFGLSFREAWRMSAASSVFTTHTPVPAGNEIFSFESLRPYFEPYAATLGLSWEEFCVLGSQNDHVSDDGFSMTVLGLKGSTFRNGVSELHGDVARRMWQGVWSMADLSEIPIGAVTNGVHTSTWVSRELAEVYDRYLGTAWRTDPSDPSAWSNIDAIPDVELWRVHERRRERLVLGARDHIVNNHNVSLTQEQLLRIHEHLDPDIFTVGFARRFASYKRADLLFRDMDRLSRLVLDAKRPMQIILAGKAHPRDTEGKDLLASVVQKIRKHGLEHRVIFLEDYEMDIARLLVRGCDIWLNTPRRPYEASGTSGMKAAMNGVIHCSILDGWWAEAFDGSNGFAIGHGETLEPDQQDVADSETLYDLLEHVAIPMFYDTGKTRVPDRWVALMKRSISTLAPRFAAHRMVKQYAQEAYVPAASRFEIFSRNGAEGARSLDAFFRHVAGQWPHVSVEAVEILGTSAAFVGKTVHVRTTVRLAGLSPGDVIVEALYGRVDSKGDISPLRTIQLSHTGGDSASATFEGEYVCEESGLQGCGVRVMPSHPLLVSSLDAHRIVYATT